MKKSLLVLTACLLSAATLTGQPRYDYDKLQREDLGRGVVAIRKDASTVCLSWRYLSSDPADTGFNIYRNGRKVNTAPVTASTFFENTYTDDKAAVYEVRPVNQGRENHRKRGQYTLPAHAPTGYVNIPLNRPSDGTTPTGDTYTYIPNDASVGDVDGDGEYEIILKWDPSNAHDNSHDGYTGEVLLDCYRLNGEQLWRINLGRNIRAGAHYTPFIVYDLDTTARLKWSSAQPTGLLTQKETSSAMPGQTTVLPVNPDALPNTLPSPTTRDASSRGRNISRSSPD